MLEPSVPLSLILSYLSFIGKNLVVSMERTSFDIEGAYLNADIPESHPTYCTMSPELRAAVHKTMGWPLTSIECPVYRLRRALYGHPLAGDWFSNWAASDIKDFGMTLLAEDVSDSFWIYREPRTGEICGALVLYVDDAVLGRDVREVLGDEVLGGRAAHAELRDDALVDEALRVRERVRVQLVAVLELELARDLPELGAVAARLARRRGPEQRVHARAELRAAAAGRSGHSAVCNTECPIPLRCIALRSTRRNGA